MWQSNLLPMCQRSICRDASFQCARGASCCTTTGLITSDIWVQASFIIQPGLYSFPRRHQVTLLWLWTPHAQYYPCSTPHLEIELTLRLTAHTHNNCYQKKRWQKPCFSIYPFTTKKGLQIQGSQCGARFLKGGIWCCNFNMIHSFTILRKLKGYREWIKPWQIFFR